MTDENCNCVLCGLELNGGRVFGRFVTVVEDYFAEVVPELCERCYSKLEPAGEKKIIRNPGVVPGSDGVEEF